jgi:dihydroorotase
MDRIVAITNIKGRDAALILDGDTISGIDQPIPDSAHVIDAKGACLAPGIVDLGVFAVDKAACIAGGITRIALMPDQSLVLDNPGLVQRAALAAKPELWVHPIAAATRGLAGVELAEFALMRDAGARAVSTGKGWISDAGVMLKALSYAGSVGLTMISHAEDGGLTANAVATAGSIASRLGMAAAPARAEALALARDIALVEETGASIHFRQVTTTQAQPKPRACQSPAALRPTIFFCPRLPLQISGLLPACLRPCVQRQTGRPA